MPMDSAYEKQRIHNLIDRLGPTQVTAVRGLLEAMIDPVARSVANAPLDDEPLTSDDAKALVEAREWIKQNPGIPHEQVLAELGITEAEINNYQEPA